MGSRSLKCVFLDLKWSCIQWNDHSIDFYTHASISNWQRFGSHRPENMQSSDTEKGMQSDRGDFSWPIIPLSLCRQCVMNVGVRLAPTGRTRTDRTQNEPSRSYWKTTQRSFRFQGNHCNSAPWCLKIFLAIPFEGVTTEFPIAHKPLTQYLRKVGNLCFCWYFSEISNVENTISLSGRKSQLTNSIIFKNMMYPYSTLDE